MNKAVKTVVYDEELHIEAYHFEGMSQPFLNHFHEYYVIGFVENGERRLLCKNKEYTLTPGSIVLFNPGDNHACTQSGGRPFDYRGFHISRDIMLTLAKEITGRHELPVFSENVIRDTEAACSLCLLHQMVMEGSAQFAREEHLILLISELLHICGRPSARIAESTVKDQTGIENACTFMKQHFSEHLSLDQICRHTGFSKSTLLRAFTKAKGVTPYRYLENIRINEAKKLLEQGLSPVDTALQTGFSDQSHFTNYFNSFIGLSPGVYRDIFLEKNDTWRKQHEES